MNSIPHNHILLPRRHTPANRKHQLPLKSQFQQLTDLPSVLIIWQIPGPRRPREIPAIPHPTLKIITHDNGRTGIPLTPHILIDVDPDRPIRLIALHNPVDD